MRSGKDQLSSREAQRQETRQRVYAAALAEFKRSGLAGADVGAIAAAASVARGTFYFHFPTKEHVLAEFERGEEARVTAQMTRFLTGLRAQPPAGSGASQPFLAAALSEVVRLMMATERRIGKPLFREMLGLHFSPRRPDLLPRADQWADYPIMTVVMEAVELGRKQGEVYDGADTLQTAQFFLLGLYAMLITSHDYQRAARAEVLGDFVATVLRSVEPR